MSKKLPKYLKVDAVIKVLAIPPNHKFRDRLILRVLYKCGLRVSELCNLEIKNIDFKDGTVKIVAGKGDKDRVVPIDQHSLDLISFHIGTRIKGPLIVSNKGGKISSRQVERLVKKYGDQAGLTNLHPHTLRHSIAVHMLKSGGPQALRSVQLFLGHSSLSITQIYLDLTIDDIKEDYNKLPEV